jgi:mannose-6-phosphate isomerase
MNPLSASDDFSDLLGRLEYWLTEHALPLWAEKGVDRCHGGFFDLIDQNGQSISGAKRGRVQGRQSWVYALAGTMGWKGPWTMVWVLRFRDDVQMGSFRH